MGTRARPATLSRAAASMVGQPKLSVAGSGGPQMRRMTRIWPWLVAVGLVASCSLLPRTPLATPGPPASSPAGGLRTFDENGITFAYPTAWREFHYSVTSSFSSVIAYLAIVDVPEPC